MNTRAIVGVALTGAVILVSCTQDQTSAPSLIPTEASFGKTSNTCDFVVMRASAKDYFALLKDPVYVKIDLMQEAYKAAGGGQAGAQAATDEGFVVLAQTAANVKDASKIKGTSEQGSKFVNDVFKCMAVAGYAPSTDFSKSLGVNGLFDVVDGTVSTPVTARYNVGNSPAFGAEPQTGQNWPVTGPTLFYGWKLDVSILSGETVQGTVADLRTLPVYSSFSSPFKAGACKVNNSFARALHQHGTDVTILAPVQMSFCIGNDDVLTQSGPAAVFASGLRRAASWLAPRPLYAAMPTFDGGGGAGLVDGLSEIGPVSFTSTVSFSNPPTNIALSAQPHSPPIAVRNATSNGNALAGVTITLAVVGNSGSYSYPPGSNIAVTNNLGIATFPNFVIDKSGGYTITATSALGGTAQATYQITGN
ncbi:MAG TPA: hypothetical protein VFS59_02695 [Gemmatimonadaceae bacterium]|nr:hypothetical protein [Gemmatimonadaceae bacterium]